MRLRWLLVLMITVASVMLIALKPLRLGLDLRGGSSFVLELQSHDRKPPSAADFLETPRVVERKINAYGMSEATVQPYGVARDRLLIQIPGSAAELPRIRASLERQGVLEWFAVAAGPFATREEPLLVRGGVLAVEEKLLPMDEDPRIQLGTLSKEPQSSAAPTCGMRGQNWT